MNGRGPKVIVGNEGIPLPSKLKCSEVFRNITTDIKSVQSTSPPDHSRIHWTNIKGAGREEHVPDNWASRQCVGVCAVCRGEIQLIQDSILCVALNHDRHMLVGAPKSIITAVVLRPRVAVSFVGTRKNVRKGKVQQMTRMLLLWHIPGAAILRFNRTRLGSIRARDRHEDEQEANARRGPAHREGLPDTGRI
jgi:hypothetical protein